MKRILTICIFLLPGMAVFSQAWKTYPYTPAGSLISFPADEGRHAAEPIEWWYTSGHLTGATTGKHYSYMLTYFYTPQYIFDGFRILNICDEDIGLFSDETKALTYNILATDRLDIEANIYLGGTETWHNKSGTGGNPLPFEYVISAQSESGTLNLVYNAVKPPLILGATGLLDLGSSDYSYYYSQTGNEVTGTITFNGISETVSGTGWIDRQYGIFNPSSGQQYEWFSVQLSNGMDFNIYNIFTADDEIPATPEFNIFAAYVDESTQYTTSDFVIERLGYSYRPDSLRCYAREWRITSQANGVDITVTATHPDNEVALPFRFFEGSTTVTGTINGNAVTGQGFAELTHYYSKPVIVIGEASDYWNMSTPLKWSTGNPDDGNPLGYDLEYSIDNRQTFTALATGITDTSYTWSDPPLAEGDSCWVRVTGYSIDKTLVGKSTRKLYATTTGINDSQNQDLFRIYPNPSNGIFTVEGMDTREIVVVDIKGRTIYRSDRVEPVQTIDLTASPKGIYFITVTTARGTATSKVITR